MPFKSNPQKFNASIKEVVIGTGNTAITLGGENVLPLYSFDAPIKNRPQVGIEISDLGPATDVKGIAAFYAGATSLKDQVKKACTSGAAFISLVLEGADPNGQNKSVEDCVAICKEAADASTLQLVIQGSKNVEKDGVLFGKIADALQGKNVLLLSAKEDNHKAIAVAAVLAYKQNIGAESAVDINLAKQLNVLISQAGVTTPSVVMNVGSAAAGYGFEYVVSTLDRVKAAALAQNDTALQCPIITPVGSEAWSVKESVVSEEDFPDWGPVEQRGIDMEVTTAAAALASGSNAVILRHPVSVKTITKLLAELI
ncbi:MAG: acetyl-CoA decarbonylase/synthase complex subunit delta [Treponema sp.]|jgi:acetyl-CoA decarbonylase/synthase complex subunit delta|nr:acetyl-CoA decarbonylase/synthase complex subunit delta [Treponema sp.]